MTDRIVMAWRWMTGRCVACGDWRAARQLHCPPCAATLDLLAEPFDLADYVEVQRPSGDDEAQRIPTEEGTQ